MSDYRQSEEYNRYFDTHGWVVERVGSTVVLVRKFPVLGSIIKIKRCPPDINLSEIEKTADRHSAVLVKIEADVRTGDDGYEALEESFRRNGYLNSRFPFCPTKTAYIDLSQDEGGLFDSFDRDARKKIKRNGETGITVETGSSIDPLYPLLAYSGEKRHFVVQEIADWKNMWGAFVNKAKVILAYKDGDLLGGNMFLTEGDTAFGIFLPLSDTGRQKHAAYTLLWEGFKWAKREGCRVFDLEGVYDERYPSAKEWLGLTAFKRKFRGREAEFIRAKVKSRCWYLKPFVWFL